MTEHRVTNYGSQIITIEGDNASAIVFVEGKINVQYGDRIQAIGKAQKYKDDWEIVVGNERFVYVIQKWQNITIPISQLAEHSTTYKGLNVNVTGYVDMVYDTYFYLINQEETHSLIVFYNPSEQDTVYPGQKIYVAAKFDYDAKNLRYKLEICEEIHGIYLSVG